MDYLGSVENKRKKTGWRRLGLMGDVEPTRDAGGRSSKGLLGTLAPGRRQRIPLARDVPPGGGCGGVYHGRLDATLEFLPGFNLLLRDKLRVAMGIAAVNRQRDFPSCDINFKLTQAAIVVIPVHACLFQILIGQLDERF